MRLISACSMVAACALIGCGSSTDVTEGTDAAAEAEAFFCDSPSPVVTHRGITSLSAPPPGATPDDNLLVLDSGEIEAAGGSEGPEPPPPGSLPRPAPTPVTRDNPGASGFNGLTHRDQLLAGTGEYAGTQPSLEPPDVPLCAGNGFILQAVNLAITAYDTRGDQLVAPTPLNQFFRLRPVLDPETGTVNEFTSDPKCYFDPEVRRWFLTIFQVDPLPVDPAESMRAHVELAVSKTDDPTGDWNLYEVDTTSDGEDGTPEVGECPCLGDQPLIGTDRFGFYFSVNLFSLETSTFQGAQVYALQKSALLRGALPKVDVLGVPALEGAGASLQPALIPPRGRFERRNGGTQYFLSSINSGRPEERIAVWAATNTRSLDRCAPDIALDQVFVTSQAYAPPPPALQQPGPTPLRRLLQDMGFDEPLERLDTGDVRMQQVYFADGKLWSGLGTAVADPERAGIAWFIVEPDVRHGLAARMVNQGYIALDDTSSAMFPAVAVNARGEGAIVYSLSGPDLFPSVGYSLLDERGAGLVHLVADGARPEDGLSGYTAFGGDGVSRWGDYSGAAVDDDGSFWLAAEYIPDLPRSTLANWGTFIAHVRRDATDPEPPRP
ncbi:hypothetical protein WMF37_20395 [Sorangium sp. So ce291]|uniref:hypothetical protein n=1 Tax=Sorangium sp. So ce291 TaxID=3133294 RepID=UPI003F5FF6EC